MVATMPDLFLAVVSTPGYLPQDDERHVYRDTASAWEYLLTERERGLDDPLSDEDDGPDEVMTRIAERLRDGDPGTGTVYGHTPGSDSPYDLGLAYGVALWEHSDYPHEAGWLVNCPVCEFTCHCSPSGDHAECVHCASVSSGESTCEDEECDEQGHC